MVQLFVELGCCGALLREGGNLVFDWVRFNKPLFLVVFTVILVLSSLHPTVVVSPSLRDSQTGGYTQIRDGIISIPTDAFPSRSGVFRSVPSGATPHEGGRPPSDLSPRAKGRGDTLF